MDQLIAQDDCVIARERNSFDTPVALLCDDEGVTLFEFPQSWSDEDIHLALRFANQTFASGVRLGVNRKIREIKACLEIE